MMQRRIVIIAMLAMAGYPFFVVPGEAHAGADSLGGTQEYPSGEREKDPRLAGTLSVFLPGLGHMYAGETIKGAALTGLFVGSIIAVTRSDIGQTNGSITPAAWTAIALLGGVYLYALIDSPFAADRANAHHGETGLLRFDTGTIVVLLDAGVRPGGPVAALRVAF